MQTRTFKLDPRTFRPEELEEPAAILKRGGLVAFPTETVYGLGANALDPDAVHRLKQVKGRSDDKPLTLHLASREDVERHVEEVPRQARLLMDRYWPGPLTIVFPGNAGQGVGVRVPANDVARELIRRSESPIVAPSANPSGGEPAIEAAAVLAYFDGKIDAVVDGGPSVIKQSSTVVRVDEAGYQVLREGIITHEMIHQLLVGKDILFVCSGNSCRSPMAAALFKMLLSRKLGCEPDDLGQLGYTIHSAGTFAIGGGWASHNAVQAMVEHGIDISSHVSRPVTVAMLEAADRIYAMGASHIRQLIEWHPGVEGKVLLLAEGGIGDPIGGDMETYRACAAEIERAICRILSGF